MREEVGSGYHSRIITLLFSCWVFFLCSTTELTPSLSSGFSLVRPGFSPGAGHLRCPGLARGRFVAFRWVTKRPGTLSERLGSNKSARRSFHHPEMPGALSFRVRVVLAPHTQSPLSTPQPTLQHDYAPSWLLDHTSTEGELRLRCLTMALKGEAKRTPCFSHGYILFGVLSFGWC